MKRSLIYNSIFFAIVGLFIAFFISSDQKEAKAGIQSSLAPRSEEEQQVIDVYKATNEAVVFITTVSITFDIFSGIQPEEGTGSGVIIDSEKGIILTNFHVIANAKQVEVSLAQGGVYSAKLLGFDAESDIAVLRLIDPPKDLVSIPFGDSSSLEVGQQVLAIGNPFGLNRTLTIGNISSLNRAIRRNDTSLMRGLIQTDASINVGNSGGPLLDKAGKIIGINAAILSRSGDSAGIGFAVPINLVRRILPELIATGKVLRPEMGWVLIDTDQGPMVHQVIPGGPADEAQIRPIMKKVQGSFIAGYVRDLDNADLIYSVNGHKVTLKDQVDDLIAQTKPNRLIQLELRRGGKEGASRKVEIRPVLR